MKYLLSFLTISTLITTPTLSLNDHEIKTLTKNSYINPIYPTFDENVYQSTSTSGWTNWSTSLTWNSDFSYWIDVRYRAINIEKFLKNYATITINYSGYIDWGTGRQNYKNSQTFSLTDSANILFSHEYDWHPDVSKGTASYELHIFDSSIELKFKTMAYSFGVGVPTCWATTYLFVNYLTFNSTYDINATYNNLKTALTNKSLEFTSDYSGDILDPNNIIDPTGKGNDETNLIINIIKNVLGQDFQYWRSYLEPFAFNSQTNIVTVTIDVNELDSSQTTKWVFSPKINVSLSNDYWSKEISKRLHFFPGKIVNPQDSTKGMINDEPEIILEPEPFFGKGGEMRYHVPMSLEFDGTLDNSEYVTINDIPVSVLNDKFKANLIDNRVNNDDAKDDPSTYEIKIYHKENNNNNNLKYTITIDVNSLTSDLQLKWYAWNPNKNSDQKILITPTLPNGKQNPQYDPEINEKTGTKTQIIWVKHKSLVPTPLDPLNQNGDVINNSNDYDLGYIAEGAVAGMGVNQTFDIKNVNLVNREGIKNDLTAFVDPTPRQKQINITSDAESGYWSDEGIWHYNEVLKDNQAVQKYIVIGAKYQNKYPRFLDVLNNSNIAVEFWTTIHGVHLKNYLNHYLNFDSSAIQKLTYEQVVTYWNQFVSDVVSQRIPPEPMPDHHYNLNGSLPEIKMNQQEVSKILATINNEVALDINKFVVNAQLGVDYNIYTANGLGKDINIDNSVLTSLLDDKIAPQYLKLNVKSTATSVLLTGQTCIQVRNSIHYDPGKVDDLSKIKFNNYQYNFSNFTVEKLRDWIIKNINNYLTVYKYLNLKINDDYGVTDNVIPLDDKNHNNTPGDLSDKVLQRFISNEIEGKLTIILYANDNSDLTVGQSSFILTNDAQFPPVPPVPPSPPNPNPIPNNNKTRTYLTWIFSVLISLLIMSGVGYYVYRVRTRKGLPGIKITVNKNKLLSKKKLQENNKKKNS